MANSPSYPLSEFLQGKGDVDFDQFVADARAAGLRPDTWLKEKHSGKLETELLPDGRHVIRAVSAS